MQDKVYELLKKYWGELTLHSAQVSIIEAVLKRQDVLAILPTGAGKSLCYQLPALCVSGLTLIVSPLLALMYDQVSSLQRRGIAAAAIDLTLPEREIDNIFARASVAGIKCLYVSAERITDPHFLDAIRKLPIDILVVDEAHCISVWGHDFRPAYQSLHLLRAHITSPPIVALTATATSAVEEDIRKVLQLRAPCYLRQSMFRKEIMFSVHKTSNKLQKACEVLSTVKAALVYVPTRAATTSWSNRLRRFNLSVGAYHAGLSLRVRERLQDQWIGNKLRVMVATSAFGMGVNKRDLDLVLHLCVPQSLSSYYQEAGRAGRARQLSKAVILYHTDDLRWAQKVLSLRYPSLTFIQRVYQALNNYYKIALGTGNFSSYPFDIEAFTKTYYLPVKEAYYALQQLVYSGRIQFSEPYGRSSVLRLLVDRKTLYNYELHRPRFAWLMETLLRKFGGKLFTESCHFQERNIQRDLPAKEIRQLLLAAKDAGIAYYFAYTTQTYVTFLMPRCEVEHLNLQGMRKQQQYAVREQQYVCNYLQEEKTCRVRNLLSYFGEEISPCKTCDLCQSHTTSST